MFFQLEYQISNVLYVFRQCYLSSGDFFPHHAVIAIIVPCFGSYEKFFQLQYQISNVLYKFRQCYLSSGDFFHHHAVIAILVPCFGSYEIFCLIYYASNFYKSFKFPCINITPLHHTTIFFNTLSSIIMFLKD